MEESLVNLKTIYALNEFKKFTDLLSNEIKVANNSAQRKLEFKTKYAEKNAAKEIGIEEIAEIISFECGMKYFNISSIKEYNFPLEDINLAINGIASDPRVFFVSRCGIFSVLSNYVDLRIYCKMINDMFPAYSGRKKSNLLHLHYLEIINLKNSNSPTIAIGEEIHFDSYIDEVAKRDYFFNIKNELDKIMSGEPQIILEQETIDFGKILKGDMRYIQKYIFPSLCESIMLNKQVESNFRDSGHSIKQNLLFDLLKLICTEKVFPSENEFKKMDMSDKNTYASYYHYQIDFVKGVIGK